MKNGRQLILVLGILFCANLYAAEAEAPVPEDPGRLDGVPIEALETYVNPKHSEISLGASLYPLDPYYLGFGLTAGYSYFFTKSFGWEVVSGTYAFSVQKDLTAQLAQDFGVNPKVIEKLEYLVTSNLMYLPSYGKSVVFGSFIQYVRAAFFLGGGLVRTTLVSKPAVCVGARLDNYIGHSFSWRLELRDHILVEGGQQFLSVAMGTSVLF